MVALLTPDQRERRLSDKIVKEAGDISLIVFACEAGMGSSLMGANQLKKMCKKAKLDVTVVHSPVSQMPAEVDLIVTHQSLAAVARAAAPEAAVVSFMMFFGDPAVKEVVEKLKNNQAIESVV